MSGDRLWAEREELRLAVVFNGGVSLAVWMGGVAHEINELTREAGVYGRLMAALEVRARADVISGTSAGGINGAALSLGQVNRSADLSALRDVWADQGRLESLLHTPFRGEPASLLRGEEVFLPELNRALHQLTARWDPHPVVDRPIDLTITTTLLDGAVLSTTDTFGQTLTQRRHDGTFRFVRLDEAGTALRDQFDEDIADALALAARASAGFPLAFEPTLIPVDPDDDGARPATSPVRPDMAEFASWRADGTSGRDPVDRSRYAVDGGLLNNTPTQHALRAVQRMPAGTAVDRVLALVAPLPGGPDTDPAADPDQPPTVTRTLRGLLAALTSQGNRTFVDDVAEHNRRALSRKDTRRDVVLPDPRGGQDPADLARALFPQYRLLRLRRDARDLAARVHRPDGWAYEQVRAALEAAQEAQARAVGYVPDRFEEMTTEVPAPGTPWVWGTTPALDVADVALEYLRAVRDAWPTADQSALRSAREQVHAAAATVRWVHDCIDATWRDSPELATAVPDQDYWTMRLHAYAWLTRADAAARDDLLGRGPAVVQGVARLAAAVRAGPQAPPPAALPDAPAVLAASGGLLGQILGSAVADMLAAVLAPTRPGGPAALDDAARTALSGTVDPAWRSLLDATTAADPEWVTWGLLAAVHVASWTVADELPTENTNPVRLTQVSAESPNPFAVFSRTVPEKLGGASLSRFSGFLKRSWRMNDWTWGRCDATTMLLRVLVTPERVRALAVRHRLTAPADVVDLLVATAFGPDAATVVDDADVRTALGDLRRRALSEITALLDPSLPDPRRASPGYFDPAPAPVGLPALAALLTYARHVTVILDELPRIADAIRRDRADGANPRSRGEVFLTEQAHLLDRLHVPPAEGSAAHLTVGLECLDAFDRAGVGREPLDEEAASDQLIRTAVTSVAVAATVADGPRSGLGFARPVTRAVRGAALLPYWVTLGLTSGGRIARWLGALGLAAGGVLIVLALLGVLQGAFAGVAATVGAGAFLAALTYGAMRTGSHLHSVVLVAAAALLLGVGWTTARNGWDAGLGLGAAVGALVVVAGLMLLGSVPHPVRSPRTVLTDGMLTLVGWVQQRRPTGAAARRVAVVGSLLVAALLLVVLYVALMWGLSQAEHQPPPFGAWADRAPLAALGAVVVIALAGAAVLLAGRGLRRWQHRDGTWQLERDGGTAAAAAGWSVIYGVGALLLTGAALAWWPADAVWDGRLVLWALLGFAAALLTVVPLTVLGRARGRIRRRVQEVLDLIDRRLPATDRTGLVLSTRQERFAARLESLDLAYHFLVRRTAGADRSRLQLRFRPARLLLPQSRGSSPSRGSTQPAPSGPSADLR